MGASSTRGAAGTTVWSTETANQLIHELAKEMPKRAGRGADRRVGDALIQMLERYKATVPSLAKPDRPCFVGTLLGYPGAERAGTRTREEDPRAPGSQKSVRRNEKVQPGSKRLFLRSDSKGLLNELVQYGLVLDCQVVRTRPLGLRVHTADDPTRAARRTGRPLTDVVLTSVLLATEKPRLSDQPLCEIERQVLRQQTAQRLWDIALKSARADTFPEFEGRRRTQALLAKFLPTLLIDDEERIALLQATLPEWEKSLKEFAGHLDKARKAYPKQLRPMRATVEPV